MVLSLSGDSMVAVVEVVLPSLVLFDASSDDVVFLSDGVSFFVLEAVVLFSSLRALDDVFLRICCPANVVLM